MDTMDKEAWLEKLVSFDTTSCNTNLPLIKYVGEWFSLLKIPFNLTYDVTKTKANLFATLPASDGSLNGGVILSGHTDVVPVTGQTWDSDPFTVIKKDGRIYGRGTCDMKGFLAVALALIPEFQTMHRKHPVHFAFSYDEEVGCLGAPVMIADFQKRGIHPAACIVGEPTSMVPVIAHKGINSFKCCVHGLNAHSSLPNKACNAIEHGAKLVTWLRDYAGRLKNGSKDDLYDVPYTTLNSNMITGGIAINTIPSDLELKFEFRNLPEDNPDQIVQAIQEYIEEHLVPEMKKEFPEAKVELEMLNSVPSFQTAESKELLEIASEGDTTKVSYATEAGLFQRANIPTIVCGPGRIMEAHKANEYVTLEQLDKCEAFLRKVVMCERK